MKGFVRPTFIFVAIVVLMLAIAIPLLHMKPSAVSADGGVYPANIEYDHNTPYGWFEQSNLSNPNIRAVDINMNWSDVEPQQGVFNWGPADAEMQAWASAGKQFTLIVRYIHELKQRSCASNQWMPSWEIARIPNFCSAGGETIPDYFDAGFQSDLQSYVAAIQQHMAASPYLSSLVFVRIGIGMGGESDPCISCSDTNMNTLMAWGYSVNAWAMWQRSMLSGYQSTWSTAPTTAVPLIYPLGDNDKDTVTGQTVARENGYWAASLGFGVGQEGLQDTTGYASGAAIQIAQYVRAHYPSAYIQFQTVSTVPETQGVSGVNGDISIAQKADAFSIEWYQTDSISTSYQASFQQWQQTVNCTYAGLNCPPPTPTPAPGTIIAQDTFQRPNQALWGTASDGHTWSADANKLSNFSINNTTGQAVGSGTTTHTYTAILGPTVSNAEVLFSGSLSSFGGNTMGAVLRWSDSNDFYKAFISGSNLILQKKVNGTLTKLGSVALSSSANTSYTLLFSVSGSTLNASVWPTSGSQPANWMLSATDGSLSSGTAGVQEVLASGVVAQVSAFEATQQ